MRVRLAVAAALIASLAFAAPAMAFNPQQAGLQVALRAQGLYQGQIDAIAGPHTVAGVRAFQRIHHLRVTGIADAQTRAAMGPLGRPLFGSRTLQRGAFGWDVAVLQFLLVRRGIDVPINAYFDGPTLRGVRSYQRRLHLVPDGVVGPQTLAAFGHGSAVPEKRRTIVAVARRHVSSSPRPGGYRSLPPPPAPERSQGGRRPATSTPTSTSAGRSGRNPPPPPHLQHG
jgi:hypothetical protein